MKDEANPSDAIQPPARSPTTTPPAAKVSREILHPIFYIVILIVSLMSNRWKIENAPNMTTVVYGLLLINAALRKAEGSLDMSAIVEVIRETLKR